MDDRVDPNFVHPPSTPGATTVSDSHVGNTAITGTNKILELTATSAFLIAGIFGAQAFAYVGLVRLLPKPAFGTDRTTLLWLVSDLNFEPVNFCTLTQDVTVDKPMRLRLESAFDTMIRFTYEWSRLPQQSPAPDSHVATSSVNSRTNLRDTSGTLFRLPLNFGRAMFFLNPHPSKAKATDACLGGYQGPQP